MEGQIEFDGVRYMLAGWIQNIETREQTFRAACALMNGFWHSGSALPG
jgi:hypothetical protein